MNLFFSMKRLCLISLLIVVLLSLVLYKPTPSAKECEGWENVPEILKNISAPLFKDTVYDVSAYGANSDISYNSLPSIQAAIYLIHL